VLPSGGRPVGAAMNDRSARTRRAANRKRRSGRAAAPLSNKLSAIALLGVVAVAPLPFGSTDPAVIAVWCVVLGAALAVTSTRDLETKQLAPLLAVGVVACGYLIVMREQVSLHPWSQAEVNAVWGRAGKLLGEDLAPTISIVRNQPFFALGAPLAALLAFSIGYIVGFDAARARRLLHVIVWSGTFYAVLGIALFIHDPTKVLWRDKLGYVESLTGPFVNRNTAAVYFGSCACISMLLLFAELRAVRSKYKRPMTQILSVMDKSSQWRAGRQLGFIVILITALLMSASRAGIFISLFGLLLAFAAFWWRDISGRRSLLLSALAGIAIVVVLLQFLGGGVGARFNEFGVTDTLRSDIYRSTLRLIGDHPWLGSGLGTFAWAFPPYRDHGSIWGVVDRAHDTLLEIAADAGIPFAALIVVAWLGAMAMLVHGIRVRQRGLIVPVAAMSVATIGLLHSLIDFSLQIPGYAIMVFALVGVGMAQSWRPHRPDRPSANGAVAADGAADVAAKA
jgi:O-antigen ligase